MSRLEGKAEKATGTIKGIFAGKPAKTAEPKEKAAPKKGLTPFSDNATENFGGFLEPFIRGYVLETGSLNTKENSATIVIKSPQIQKTLMDFFNSQCNNSIVEYNIETKRITINAQLSDDLMRLTQDDMVNDLHNTIKQFYTQKLFLKLEFLCSEEPNLGEYLHGLSLRNLINVEYLLHDTDETPKNKIEITAKKIKETIEKINEQERIKEEKKHKEKHQQEKLKELNKVLENYLKEFISKDFLHISQANITDNGIIINCYRNPLLITSLYNLMHHKKVKIRKIDGNNIKIEADFKNINILKKLIENDSKDPSQPPIYTTFIEATFKDFLSRSLEKAPDEVKTEIEKILLEYHTTQLTKRGSSYGYNIADFKKREFSLAQYLEHFDRLCRSDIMSWVVRNEFNRSLKKQLQLRLDPTARASRVKTGFFGGLVYHEDKEPEATETKRLSVTTD